MSEPIIVQPEAGDKVRVGPNEITLKLQLGPFSIVDYRVAAKFVAPPVLHWHEDTDFAGIVLEGRLEFRFADHTAEVRGGGIVFVPRDCHFAWSNPDDAPARVLFIYSPGGFEQYFREAAALITANPGKTVPELMPQLLPLWEKYKIGREA